MKLILIRHAEPDYSIDSLTKKGWREAELLANRIQKWNVTDFFCSPLGRAKATASCTLNKIQREAVTLPWLQEFIHPVKDPETGAERIPCWDFMPAYFSQQQDLYQRDNWMNSPVMKSGNIASYYDSVCQKFDAFLESYGYFREGGFYQVKRANLEKNEEPVLVFFCHLGVSFVLIGHLLGIAPPVLWQGFFLAPSSVTVIGTEERIPGQAAFRVQVLGDTQHLSQQNESISTAGYFTSTFQN